MEENITEAEVQEDGFPINIKPYEIKTYRIQIVQ